MSSTPNGASLNLEKFPDAPPEITTSKSDNPDAGLRSLDHYKRKLPPWRYALRQRLLPMVRWETPYLALLQDKMRTPALDSYFAITANLGTHTAFMIILPILFWCGFTSFGHGMVHMLSGGVFITSVLKDMLSLPRPLSPPLQRITMSGHVSLEYGFPSTHSANAVSVAVYALYQLKSPENQLSDSTRLFLEVLSYGYAISIVLGRLYCGMHGFLDVGVGSIIGVLLAVGECTYGADVDRYLHSSSYVPMVAFAVFILLLIRFHPEPADDCPCFDDTVAFLSTSIGIELGGWHYANTKWASHIPVLGTVPFSVELLGWPKVILRIVVGVLVVFAWREVAKPNLLKFLPRLFRIIERYEMVLPRKFFTPASEYKKIPKHQRLDNVMPSVSDLPNLLKSIRHPGRGRAISVGPQSAADAYETLAYREKRRRDSLTGEDVTSPVSTRGNPFEALTHEELSKSVSSGVSSRINGNLPTPDQSRVASFEKQMGHGQIPFPPLTPGEDAVDDTAPQDDLGEKEIFSRVQKPCTHYDIEVITKLVVYIGIAMFAVEGNPIIFEYIGLGLGPPGRV